MKQSSTRWPSWVISQMRWSRLRWLLVSIAILYQGAHQYYAPTLFTDKIRQIAATRALVEGHGLTLSFADPADLSRLISEPLIGWPPGYPLVLAPILKALDSIYWSTLVIDWTSIIIFFLSWFVILECVGGTINVRTRLFIWIYWALVFSPLMFLTSSETLSLALFSATLAACLWMIGSRRSPLWLGILSGLCMGASAVVRYGYWPLLAVFPLSLAFCAMKSERKLLLAAVANAAVAGLIVGGVAAYQQWIGGHATFLTDRYSNVTQRLYWEQLLHMAPFPARALGFPPASSRFLQSLDLPPLLVNGGLWILSVIIVVAFVANLIRYFEQASTSPTRGKHQSPALFFQVSGALTFILTVAMLSYLSVRYPGDIWTYVEATRYYAPIFSFLVVAVVAVAFEGPKSDRTWLGRLFAGLVALVLLSSTITGGLWRAKHFWEGICSPVDTVDERLGKDVAAITQAVNHAHKTDLPVVYITDSDLRPNAPYTAAMAGARVYEGDISPDLLLTTTEEVSIVVDVPYEGDETIIRVLTRFHKRYGGIRIGETPSSEFFEVRFAPDQSTGAEGSEEKRK